MTGQTRREGVPTHPKARAKESRPEKGSARTGAARTGAARTRSRGEGAAPRPGFRLLILQLLSHSVKTLFTHFLRKGHTVRKARSVSPEKACWPLSAFTAQVPCGFSHGKRRVSFCGRRPLRDSVPLASPLQVWGEGSSAVVAETCLRAAGVLLAWLQSRSAWRSLNAARCHTRVLSPAPDVNPISILTLIAFAQTLSPSKVTCRDCGWT